MKVVRRITYELDTVAQMEHQLRYSAPLGALIFGGMTMTVEHVEGPQFPSDGTKWGGPKPIAEHAGTAEKGEGE